MDTLDLIKGTTAESLEGVRADFTDLPRPVYRGTRVKEMNRIVDATAAERSAAAKVRAANRRPARAPRNSVVEARDVPTDEAPVDRRSPRQIELMASLHMQLAELDEETCRKAVEYTSMMTLHGKWTPGRWDPETKQGNASRWISNMIAKVRELRDSVSSTSPVAPPATKSEWTDIPNGYYALVEDEATDTIKFYRIKHAQNGWVYVDAMASDERHPIRNAVTKQRILRDIRAMGWEASRGLYGSKIGRCGRCHRTLTDADSRTKGIGPDCEGRM